MEPTERSSRQLVLLFGIGDDTYAVPAAQVIEVLPLMRTKSLPGAPPYVLGLASTRDGLLPVVDLCWRATGTAAAGKTGTRVLVVAGRESSVAPRLGLVVERLTRAELIDVGAAEHPGAQQPGAPYLGRVVDTPRGIVQLVDVARVVPDDVWQQLSSPAEPTP